MKWLNFFCLILAFPWTFFLARGAGSIPPMGPLLSVSSEGIWSHRPHQHKNQTLSGLKAPVTVTFDRAGVPHVFASHLADAARVQGYLMASQRLFQMDLLTRITAGRVSEWGGRRALAMDEFFVKFGMRDSARQSLEHFYSDPETKEMIASFVAGVNAYIGQLDDKPPEYRILNVTPEKWEPIRVLHMAKQLTFALSGRSADLQLSQIQKRIGTEAVLDLFPEFLPGEDIIYPWTKKDRSRFERLDDFQFMTRLNHIPPMRMPDAGNGSNNWAVGGSRSATGFSLMANDTHLGHTLPNVWYEIQLATDDFNIYGVSLAAVPGIINGFNADVSWGPTNGTTDVLDYFEVEFESGSSNRYRLNGEWRDADVRTESIKLKGGTDKKVDVIWTRLGPLVHREGSIGLVARWSGHKSDIELKAVRGLYTSRNLDECLRSFSTWAAPIQNFICVDKKDVAIQHTGFIPKRQVGEGRFIMNASQGAEDFKSAVSEEERPRVVRPKEGVVLSANQRVANANYPHYLGWDYEEPFRGRQIRRLLQEKQKFSPEDMIRQQNDEFDGQAELFLPQMIQGLGVNLRLSAKEDEALKALATWSYKVEAGMWEPALYKEWFYRFRGLVFDDEWTVSSRMYYPKDLRLLELIKNTSKNSSHRDAKWVDDKSTDHRETLAEILARSYQDAFATLSRVQGEDFKKWAFGKWLNGRIPHVARLPGFGREPLWMNGSGESVRGNKGIHGPVYKIVVSHGDWPQAWIQVPGGNEGDPFSPNYGREVDSWARGEMRKVEFYRDVAEAKTKAEQVILFSP